LTNIFASSAFSLAADDRAGPWEEGRKRGEEEKGLAIQFPPFRTTRRNSTSVQFQKKKKKTGKRKGKIEELRLGHILS